jgi:hypothetical protein
MVVGDEKMMKKRRRRWKGIARQAKRSIARRLDAGNNAERWNGQGGTHQAVRHSSRLFLIPLRRAGSLFGRV